LFVGSVRQTKMAVRQVLGAHKYSLSYRIWTNVRLVTCFGFLNPVYTIQPVVKPVVQPAWQPAVSC